MESMGGGEGNGNGESCDDHHQLLLLMSEDVLIQILLWLPVISLLRFKSVCKSWRSIIESPFFIHLHATTTLPPSSLYTNKLGCSSSLLFHQYSDDEIEEDNGKLLTFSGDVFEDLVIPPFREFVLEESEGFEHFVQFLMVGCCNGIICLHDMFTRNVVLWNPAIKQSRFLPKPSNDLGFSRCFSKYYTRLFTNENDDHYTSTDLVRFGIDIKTNDYKVLLITTYKNTSFDDPYEKSPGERRVHVYSLSTDSWRCIDHSTLSAYPNLNIDEADQGLYLNGRYFFTAQYLIEEESEDYISLILSFDFTEEIFRTIQPPYDRRSYYLSGNLYFIPFGEKIALADPKIEYTEKCYSTFEYYIWVLNEQQQGVKESWTKFYTIGPPSREANDPLCITNNGEFAIIRRDWQEVPLQYVLKLHLLSLITGEEKILRSDCKNLLTVVLVYKPSLVPTGGNGAAHNSRLLGFDGTP